MAVGFSKSLSVDVDEKGEKVSPNEPQVSRKTGKRRRGRPREMDKVKINRAIKLIKKGNYEKQSVISAGLNYNTWLGWKQKGKKGIKPYDKFYEDVEMAKAESETTIVEMLHDSIENGNTGVAQWMLARKHPKRWEKTERVEAKVDNTQKIEIVRFSDKQKKSDDNETSD